MASQSQKFKSLSGSTSATSAPKSWWRDKWTIKALSLSKLTDKSMKSSQSTFALAFFDKRVEHFNAFLKDQKSKIQSYMSKSFFIYQSQKQIDFFVTLSHQISSKMRLDNSCSLVYIHMWLRISCIFNHSLNIK